MNRGSERRWVVITPDGGYSTLGRHTDPTPDELERAESQMRERGVSGYLAVMQGNPHVGPMPELMAVRPMANPAVPFEGVAAAVLEAIGRRRED